MVLKDGSFKQKEMTMFNQNPESLLHCVEGTIDNLLDKNERRLVR